MILQKKFWKKCKNCISIPFLIWACSPESRVTLYEHNIPTFENFANVHQLPNSDFTVIALSMKVKGGSGGPASYRCRRAVAVSY